MISDPPDPQDGSPQAGLRAEKARRRTQQLGHKLQNNRELGLGPPQLRRVTVSANLPGDRRVRRPAAHDRERDPERCGDAFSAGGRPAAGPQPAGREEQPGRRGRGLAGTRTQSSAGWFNQVDRSRAELGRDLSRDLIFHSIQNLCAQLLD